MITSTDLIAAVDALRAIADQLERIAGNQLIGTQATTADPPQHPLVNHIIEVVSGKHKGKRGRVSGVYPSKYDDGGFYATVHPTDGDKFFADVNACRAIDQSAPEHWRKPLAPSVRRPVAARKANGSVPW